MIDVFLAMQDDDFQEILQSDEILRDLQSEKNSTKDQYFQLMGAISKRFIVCGLRIIPITPVMWCFLYCIGNAFVKRENKITEKDIDIFLYLLHNGMQSISDDLYTKAHEFCKRNNIDYSIATQEIIEQIKLAFRPVEMLPRSVSGEQPRFNLDWLTQLCSMVCEMTNKTSDQIMFNMSLNQAYSYVIQYCRRNDLKKQIRRRNSDEINVAIYQRTLELGKEYYRQHYSK